MVNQHQERGKEWLEELLRLSRLPASIEVADGDAPIGERPSYWLTIDNSQLTSKDTQTLIGREGEVIDSIQYLANSLLNLGHDEEQQAVYVIDIDSYRARRQVELQAIAEHAAMKVRQTGKEFELKSLSAAERRQVHTLFKAFEDLETLSRGQEPDRRLVVRRRY